VAFLETKGLAIVPKGMIEDVNERRLNRQRKTLMANKAVTLKEIIDARLLPLQSKQGVRSWIESGKILPTETYVNENGLVMVMTAAIKRLGYAE